MRHKRILWLATLVVSHAHLALAANSVVVESKTVAGGATGEVISVQLSNDVDVSSMVAPLVVRSISSGAFITSLGLSYSDRLANPTVLEAKIRYQYADEDGLCKDGLPGGFHTITFADGASHLVGASPEGILLVRVKLEGTDLPAGFDVAGSINLTVDVANQAGAFDIDTTCTDPGNHLQFTASSDEHVIVPDFYKGTITVSNTTVLNLNDAGPGSLRAVLGFANTNPGPDAIGFAVAGTIHLLNPLEPIADASGGTFIDGYTAPGSDPPATPTVVLDGSSAGSTAGLRVESSGNRIEGLAIRKFGGPGVAVTGASSVGNTISNCSFYANGGPGIDLGGNGTTVNDPGDGDSGPNTFLNYPDFDSVIEVSPGAFQVWGNALPLSHIELYLASEAGNLLFQPEGTDHGPGYHVLGYNDADAGGVFFIPTIFEPEWSRVTATATDVSGNTSEFAQNKDLTPTPMRITAYSEPNPPLRQSMSMPSVSPAIQVWVFSPPEALGKIDTIGPSKNTFGTRASYDSLTDVNGNGLPDTRVVILLPSAGVYHIEYILVGNPGNYTAGIGVDGHAEATQSVTFTAPGQEKETTYNLAPAKRGELTGDGVFNVNDVIKSIGYVFMGIPLPDPPELVDVNCDGVPDVNDVLYLIRYVFINGVAPCQ